MAARVWQGVKSAFGFSADDPQLSLHGTNVDQPLVIEASRVSFESRKGIGVSSFATEYQGKYKGQPCNIRVFKSGLVRKDIEKGLEPSSIIQHHPNIVLVHGLWYGNAANPLPDKQPTLVMELCHISLSKYLKDKYLRAEVGQFKLVSKLEILRDVAAGMVYLHSVSIVHGNLTARNVLLSVNGQEVIAKVAEFGLTCVLDPDAIQHVTDPQGSDNMPPEVTTCLDQVELTRAVDVFSFGCLIPHVVSCVYPTPSGGASEFQKRVHFIRDDPCLHVFEPLMKRCLDKRPSARGTFEDVMEDIQPHLHKYSKTKNTESMEEKRREIEKMKSHATKLQRECAELKEENTTLAARIRESQDTVSQNGKEIKRLNDNLAKAETEHKTTRALKESAEKERNTAKQNVMQSKDDLEKLRAELKAKDRNLQTVKREKEEAAAAGEKAITQKAKEAQQREQKLNAELRKYRDDLKAAQDAKAKVQQSEETLKEEKSAADKKVRELTFKLDVRAEDISKKEKQIYNLSRQLEDAQKAIEEGNALEPVLRKTIEELEDDKTDLMDKMEKTVCKLKKTEKELTNAKAAQEALEQERDQKTKTIRDLEGERENQAYSIQELDSALTKMSARNVELQGQCVKEAESCRLMKEAKGSAIERAEDLQRQLTALHEDHEKHRKAHLKLMQEKTEFVEKVKEEKEQKKVHFRCLVKDLQDTVEESERAREQMKLMQSSLNAVSLELKAKEKEKESVEDDLKSMTQHLRRKEEELDALADKCNSLESNIREMESMISALSARSEEFKWQRDEETEKCHFLESECNQLRCSMQELKTTLNETTAHTAVLKEQLGEEAEKYRLMEMERDSATDRVEELEKQLSDLHMDHEKLRKGQILDVHERINYIEELLDSEQQKEADLESADLDYQALKVKLEAAVEDGILTKKSLDRVSAELEVKEEELRSTEEHLKTTKHVLKAKEDECYALEHAQLDLLPQIEELQGEKQQLSAQMVQLHTQVVEQDVQLMQMRTELAKSEAESDALHGQLKDFAGIKAENESLRNDAEEKAAMIRYWNEKAKQLKEFEKHLNKKQMEFEKHWNKKQMELAANRRLVIELKKKLDRELVTKKNLQSTVKQSVRESLTERGEELLNTSVKEGSEDSLDSSFIGGPMHFTDKILLAEQSQQKIKAIEESSQEALEQKEKEILLLQHQLEIMKLEVEQQKKETQVADGTVQEYTSMIHILAKCYFQSHQYPPFLYQLNQKGLPSSGIENVSKLCKKVDVSAITDLRLFHPDESWQDEIQCLIKELRVMPSKDCQAYASFSFLQCIGAITFYRFHAVLVPQVLSCEPEIHPTELEGGAKPKAMLVYAHTQLRTEDLAKDFGITAHAKGVLLTSVFEGDFPELTTRLDELPAIPSVLEDTERYLDAIILRELQCRYREFATPRSVHAVPCSIGHGCGHGSQ